MTRGRLDIARRADLRPAHAGFIARVTASMIREHGSYEAARAALVKNFHQGAGRGQ